MIEIKEKNKKPPYLFFYDLLDKAYLNYQDSVDAISISSFNKNKNEVQCRYVNLKYIIDEEWIFFSNYESEKAKSFNSHNQIAAVFYWSSINVQIRMKAKIKKTSNAFNEEYFYERSEEKNALAISSHQSKPIDSYKQVKENYNKSLERDNLKKCPEYWGGFSFIPYYFEFWEGHESRVNIREVFNNIDGIWKHSFLQP